MPLIRATIMKGYSSPEQRTELATRLADTLIDIYGEVVRLQIQSIVDEVPPGDWLISGMVPDADLVARSSLVSQEHFANRVTKERVEAAYATLASKDRAAIEEYWNQDMVWVAPGESQISGTKKGLNEFLRFMNTVNALSGNSFVMERYGVLVSSDQSVDLSHNTATRAGYPDRKLSIEVAHVLQWRDGKIVQGRGAIFGTGTTEYNKFWD
jgi:ketosteroid isomerase-like protein/phenylpyruvate tautomerase PptA (4-oxalocrotonate tautomerase family)